MNITSADKRDFLISISKGRLPQDASFDAALNYWYHKPTYEDLETAVAKIAFTTLARTVRGLQRNPAHDALKSEATDYLVSRLKSLPTQDLTQPAFDLWHEQTATALIAIFEKHNQLFTYGQAQKWINISLKHLSLASPETVESYYSFCHIPIDSYIIAALKSDLVPEDLRQIDINFGEDGPTPWSKISNYNSYLKFQQDLRRQISESPLDFEFHLWQAQKAITEGNLNRAKNQ